MTTTTDPRPPAGPEQGQGDVAARLINRIKAGLDFCRIKHDLTSFSQRDTDGMIRFRVLDDGFWAAMTVDPISGKTWSNAPLTKPLSDVAEIVADMYAKVSGARLPPPDRPAPVARPTVEHLGHELHTHYMHEQDALQPDEHVDVDDWGFWERIAATAITALAAEPAPGLGEG